MAIARQRAYHQRHNKRHSSRNTPPMTSIITGELSTISATLTWMRALPMTRARLQALDLALDFGEEVVGHVLCPK
jgi:hypothetical protein